MGEKKDFLTELSREVDAKKQGKRDSIDSVESFVSKHHPSKIDEDAELDYPDEDAPKAVKAAPAPSPAKPAPQPAAAAPQETAEAEPQPAEEAPEQPQEAPEEAEEVSDSREEMYGNPKSPDAFQEEQREKIEKPAFHIPMGAIIGGIGAILLIGFLVWFFVFRASISMPNFVGKTLDDVSAWAKQNKIESSSIATTAPEYSMDYADGMVLKQSVNEGTMIKKTTPITLTLSQGPDPTESIAFPDIKNMSQSDIKDWIDTNKLLKTKLTTQYSTTVPSGSVISYDLKNVSESDFTRGSTLNIICSKGAAPAGQVTVENYVGKTFTEFQTWATNKKLTLTKQEQFSDTVTTDYVISQGVAAGQTVNEGDSITVVVSKGKGITVPNLVGYTDTQLKAWQAGAGSGITIITKPVYSSALVGVVLKQDLPAGSQVGTGTVMTLTTSLYLPIVEKTSNEWLGKDFMELKTWVDEANGNGADIQAGEYGSDFQPVCSDTYKTPGQIVKYACLYGTNDLADGCGRPLTTHSRIAYQVSTGACTVANPDIVITNSDIASLTTIKTWCDGNHVACTINASSSSDTVHVDYTNSDGTPMHKDTTTSGTFQDIIQPGSSVTVLYNPSPSASPKP